MSEAMLLKGMVEQIFDTSKEPWERKACGRQKCHELIVRLEEFTRKSGFGNKERCEIPDACIPNIRRVYETELKNS